MVQLSRDRLLDTQVGLEEDSKEPESSANGGGFSKFSSLTKDLSQVLENNLKVLPGRAKVQLPSEALYSTSKTDPRLK